MKHLIFIGKRGSGKSLFAKMIFGTERTMWINGYKGLLNNPFLFEHRGAWNFNTIVIDNCTPDFNIETFYNFLFAELLKIDRQGRESITVPMPRFVFILESENLLPINYPSFKRRFKVIDFDKHKISSLIKLIQTEKIIIKTAQ